MAVAILSHSRGSDHSATGAQVCCLKCPPELVTSNGLIAVVEMADYSCKTAVSYFLRRGMSPRRHPNSASSASWLRSGIAPGSTDLVPARVPELPD